MKSEGLILETLPNLEIHDEVRESLLAHRPVVALETAVVTHGLPFPENVQAMHAMERAVRTGGAVPAICLAMRGKLHVGASTSLVEEAAENPRREKAAVRDLGFILASDVPGGLTVSATLFAAQKSGIRVFATGGIGGAHIGSTETGDISADLLQLARSPVLTVCSGAKSVLDLPRTLEFLEMAGVPVYSFGSTRFPAFYLVDSGLETPAVNSAPEAARIASVHWSLGSESGVVLAQPIPVKHAITADQWDEWLRLAHDQAVAERVHGKAVTPFLLNRIAQLSQGRTVSANVALLQSNAALAAKIAGALDV